MTTNRTTLINNNTMISNNMITKNTPCDKHHHDNEEPMNITMVIRTNMTTSNMTTSKKVFEKASNKRTRKTREHK
jgi:hypothetical protein